MASSKASSTDLSDALPVSAPELGTIFGSSQLTKQIVKL